MVGASGVSCADVTVPRSSSRSGRSGRGPAGGALVQDPAQLVAQQLLGARVVDGRGRGGRAASGRPARGAGCAAPRRPRARRGGSRGSGGTTRCAGRAGRARPPARRGRSRRPARPAPRRRAAPRRRPRARSRARAAARRPGRGSAGRRASMAKNAMTPAGHPPPPASPAGHRATVRVRRLAWIDVERVQRLAPVLVGHRVVGEAGLAVEVGQPGHRARSAPTRSSTPSTNSAVVCQGRRSTPARIACCSNRCQHSTIALRGSPSMASRAALLLGVLGHHLGDLGRRAEHLELDVLGSTSPSPRRARPPQLPAACAAGAPRGTGARRR